MSRILTPARAFLRRMSQVLAAAVLAAGASRLEAEDYRFTIDAPGEVLLGEGGAAVSFEASCRLEIAAGAAGVEGWSVGVAVGGRSRSPPRRSTEPSPPIAAPTLRGSGTAGSRARNSSRRTASRAPRAV